MCELNTEELVSNLINPNNRGFIPGSTIHIEDWEKYMQERIGRARRKEEKERLFLILKNTPDLVRRFWKSWRAGEEPDREAVEALRRVGNWKRAQSSPAEWKLYPLSIIVENKDMIARGLAGDGRPTSLLHSVNGKSRKKFRHR